MALQLTTTVSALLLPNEPHKESMTGGHVGGGSTHQFGSREKASKVCTEDVWASFGERTPMSLGSPRLTPEGQGPQALPKACTKPTRLHNASRY